MRTIWMVVLAAALAGGCAQNVGPDEFLMTYRQSVPTGAGERDFTASYDGMEGGYHYLQVRRRSSTDSAQDMLLWGGFHDQTYRCRAAQLPQDFPMGFLRAYEDGVTHESDAASRRYVEQYLYEHGHAH